MIKATSDATERFGFGTRAVHVGQEPGNGYQGQTFKQSS